MSAKMVASTAKPITPTRINTAKAFIQGAAGPDKRDSAFASPRAAKRHCIEHEAGNEAQEPQ